MTRANANLTSKSVDILVKSIDVNAMLGINDLSDYDKPTTPDEITWACMSAIAGMGLKSSSAERIRKAVADYDNSEVSVEYGNGVLMSSPNMTNPDGSKTHTRIGYSLHKLHGDWLVVVDMVDEYISPSESEVRSLYNM